MATTQYRTKRRPLQWILDDDEFFSNCDPSYTKDRIQSIINVGFRNFIFHKSHTGTFIPQEIISEEFYYVLQIMYQEEINFLIYNHYKKDEEYIIIALVVLKEKSTRDIYNFIIKITFDCDNEYKYIIQII